METRFADEQFIGFLREAALPWIWKKGHGRISPIVDV